MKEFELSCEYIYNFVIVDVKLAECPIESIVDTAAQVTVVNTDVFTNLFGKDIAPTETIRLKCAGADQYLLAKLYMNIPIIIGSIPVLQDMYVANIADKMLLGLDFLMKHKVIIDLSECCLKVLDCLIPFVFMRNAANEGYCVSKVSLSEKVHIPPKTVQNVEVVSADQETAAPNLTQSSESFLADLLESNSEPLCSNQESVELAPRPAAQPSRTGRVRRRPAQLKDYFG